VKDEGSMAGSKGISSETPSTSMIKSFEQSQLLARDVGEDTDDSEGKLDEAGDGGSE
jgi:hypothetical protein